MTTISCWFVEIQLFGFNLGHKIWFFFGSFGSNAKEPVQS